MTKRMIVHDRRLGGNAPAIAQNTYIVDASISTAHIINWVATYALTQGGLDELLVMCHGISTNFDCVELTTNQETIGFHGLQLGREDLGLSNVNLTRAWNSKINRIYLYSCSVAMSARNRDTQADGKRFCGELALLSGAHVYTAEQLQEYSLRRSLWQSFWDRNQDRTIDFGVWEGDVFEFSPRSGRATIAKRPGAAHRQEWRH